MQRENSTLQRRLAAILAADVVGYSRLMGEDQVRTLDALRELRKKLFEPAVANHNGTVIKDMGDGWIVEFASVSDAVNCAIYVQTELADHEVVKLRMGIHTGEVVLEDHDLFGEGVNIAARLEALTGPGSILISDNAYNSLDAKAAVQFTEFGTYQLKNIARPINVWSWSLPGSVMPADNSTANVLNTAKGEKPSIAVLPFDNMSGDAEQEYFSDGISEDIITELSRFRGFHIIARNSTFTYKGKAVDIKTVGKELGVRYILEGSVRKAGNRLRITAQLIEAATSNHVWADRYDRELTDIFDIQDEITTTIAAAILPAFETAELQRINHLRPENLDAWDLTLQASNFANRGTKEGFSKGREVAEKAITFEPRNSQCLALLSWCIGWQVAFGYSQSLEKDLNIGFKAANRAIELDPSNAVALRSLSGFLMLKGRIDEAIDAAERCVKLNVNFDQGWFMYSCALVASGRYEEALVAYERGVRLSPRNPMMGIWTLQLSSGAFALERYEEGLKYANQAVRELPNYFGLHRARAANLSMLGRMEEAAAAVKETLRLEPKTSIASTRARLSFHRDAFLDRYCTALEKAGLPLE
jgi:adenylate cyclase